jgi:aspartyl-tRNA(Asn)/glutamyl-tRNA(Gln) amidotransferase subunit A
VIDARALREVHGSGQRRVTTTIDETLERIERLDPDIGALSVVLASSARTRAAELDARHGRGEPCGALHGVPVVLKSNLCLAGEITSCGSRLLADWRPTYTATCVERLLAAGAVPVGLAHMDEFAMGSSGENSAFRATRNPWDLERIPGGSSSGCAAAVAAGLVPLALGSDTGGSVRQPAALCGIAGFKPTYGRISRHGLVAFGSSLDQVSPLARHVHDLELALGVLSGVDPCDATTLDEGPVEPLDDLELAGMRIGVPAEFLGPGLDREVRAVVEEALAELERAGTVLVPLSLPTTAYAIACYYVIATAEASSNLARFDGVRYGARRDGDGSLAGMMAATREAGFGPEVKRRILLGTFVLSHGYADEWYAKAQGVRAALRRELNTALARVDLLVGPTSPTPAFRLGERADDPLAMYLSDVLTVPASLAGLPAVSVPAGFAVRDGRPLPVGLQLVGRAGADARVLAAARAFEARTAHHERRPELAT